MNISNKVYSQNIDKLYEKIDLFSEVLEKIQNEYVEEIDQAEAMDSAINGLSAIFRSIFSLYESRNF